ncbi:hypothetical protein VitviT2T_030605 [Vitis vinifera]|uniref:Reverse transcriptase Ty1/copia-type domain-containing protein n=1 Tax=Vitis vinifera TaxID=29760 RepID=A0ABY9E405_VITVI|nr:hypothetical protein VitviT2T_030605 [Vitis vinifera]
MINSSSLITLTYLSRFNTYTTLSSSFPGLKEIQWLIKRFKYILVAKGFDQRLRIDFQFTFNPVVKPTIVWLILTLALHFGWLIYQLDSNNAFLQSHLEDDVYMAQLPWFLNDAYPIHV